MLTDVVVDEMDKIFNFNYLAKMDSKTMFGGTKTEHPVTV